MKTKILSLILILALAFNVNSQSFQKKQIDFNIGLGLGSTYLRNSYSAASSYTALPVLSISGEYGITEEISGGLFLAFSGANYKYNYSSWCGNNGNGNSFGSYVNYTDTYSYQYYIFGARGAYHFGKLIEIAELDLYAGLMLGDYIAHRSYTNNDPCSSTYNTSFSNSYVRLVGALYVGGRYRFTEHVGVFGEFGYGISYLNVGLNYRL